MRFILILLLLVAGTTLAQEPVTLFQASLDSKIDLKFVPLDANHANIIVMNKTGEEIKIELPLVFGAKHVLPQFAGQGQFPGGGQQGQQQGGGLGQNVGGGIGGGMGAGGGQGFGGGGFFNVEANKRRIFSVKTVCLEHGKLDPNPRMKYIIVPLSTVTKNPIVQDLCAYLGYRDTSSKVIQAAVWNIGNGISWDELANKNRKESQYTGNEKYFTRDELESAYGLIDSYKESHKDET